MNQPTDISSKLSLIRLPLLTATVLVVFSLCRPVMGDSLTDAMTPSGLTPGTPAGSYALSDFDNVNFYNGAMNFHLPLHQVAGRGGAGYTMMLPIEQHWRVESFYPSFNVPVYNWWQGLTPGYGPGVLQGRQSAETCIGELGEIRNSLTRLTFTTPEGTEFELVDQLKQGEPRAFACYDNTNMPSRGTVFVTVDGESATFVSDATIYDTGGTGLYYPSGYLSLRDGTRYRIIGGLVSWMRDRNGNKLTFAYDGSNRVTSITDSLNRQVTVAYDVNDGAPYGVCDRITFKGYGGATRYLRVSKTEMGNVLRSGYSLMTPNQLFPQLNAQMWYNHNPTVTSAVWLPDGRSYQLQYNPYGELARVVLPTGGAYEYDYAGGLNDGHASGAVITGWGEYEPIYEIYRRIIERRVYPDGDSGSSFTRKTTYSRPEGLYSSTAYIEVDDRDQANALLARSRHYYNSSAYLSFFISGGLFTWTIGEGKEITTEELASNGTTVLRRKEDTLTPRAYFTWPVCCSGVQLYYDYLVTQTVATLVDTNQVSKETYSYDQFNNKTDTYEYDYGSGAAGSLIRRTHTDFLTTNPVNSTDYTGTSIHIRSLPTQVSVYDASSNEKSRTTFEYDKYSGDSNHAALISRSGISGLDSGYTTSYTTRGNATRVERVKFGTTNTYVDSYSQYDQAGNVVKAIDPNGNATNIAYDDSYGAPDGNATSNTAPTELSSVSQTSFAFPTSITNALSQTAFGQYDYYLGRPVDGQDLNGAVASGYYDDYLDRPTKVIIDANNLSAKSQKLFNYDDTNKKITTLSDFSMFNDQAIKNELYYDGLGRTTSTRQYETSTAYIRTDQTYDALGRKYQTSNPYRTGDTVYQTTTAYDSLDRVISVTTPDSAVVSTSYSGNAVTVTDQAGKLRRSITDGLGRLTRLDEPDNSSGTGSLGTVSSPNQATSYSYDVLDDLTGVTQGSQTRTFAYDSLKRLTSATNPENGTVSYGYDSNGNLTSKTDARSITTTIAYDALNRPTSKSYNDSPQTATVNYYYDSQTLPTGAPSYSRGYSTGKLVAVTFGGGSEGTYRAYDALGRIPLQYQRTNSTNHQVGATYNIGGPMASETYPSVPGATGRRQVSFSYDAAARLSSVSSSATTYAAAASVSSIGYTAHNALSTETYGNSLIHAISYNTRLQPSEIKLGTSGSPTSVVDLTYSYGTTSNNGNVNSISYSGGGLSYTQNFTYDSLNRLATSNEMNGATTNWTQNNAYDRYGNRQIDLGGGSYNLSFNTSNKITTSGYSYDSSGNLTNDTVHAYTFDAENKISKVDGIVAYTYNGEGQRVKKNVGESVWFIYDIGGELIMEFNVKGGSLAKEYVNGGGMEAVIDPSTGTEYTTSDTLGSPRLVTNSSGSVVSRHDYMPFGEELSSGIGGRTTGMGYGATDGIRQQFTGKERDNETGLDYFDARYLASFQGRFTSPDPLSIEFNRLNDPQQLNNYSYCINNPFRHTDPTGLDITFNGLDADLLVDDLNHRKKAQFQVKRDKSGLLQVDGKVDPSKLNKSERALYNAVTDTQHHAVIEGIGENKDVDFGSFGGERNPPTPGTNYVDTSDMKLLRNADQTSAGEAVGHEVMEAFSSAVNPSESYAQAHADASQYFPEPSFSARTLPGEEGKPLLTGLSTTWKWKRADRSVTVTYKFDSPIPSASVATQHRGHIIAIVKNQ